MNRPDSPSFPSKAPGSMPTDRPTMFGLLAITTFIIASTARRSGDPVATLPATAFATVAATADPSTILRETSLA